MNTKLMNSVEDLVKAYNEEQAAKIAAEAAAAKAAFTPTTKPGGAKGFGTLASLAGTGKTYFLVYVQDHKIITPSAVLDGTALINACVAGGGDPDRKYVQVRTAGGNLIHAQLPDESANRPYGTSFDFVDAALYSLLNA